MATMAGTVDMDKKAKYPIVLSDSLLGRGTKELFTGIRYNHKPSVSSDNLLSKQLTPSTSSDTTKYDLSFSEGPDKYEYHGVRNSGDGQYVLIFDPAKKHFVLHQVDSTFDINLTSTPWDQDPASLRASYPQLDSSSKPRRKISQQKLRSTKEDTSTGMDSANDGRRRKVEKPKKPKPPRREPTPDAEDEDSDDGLTIEYPDGPPPARYQALSSPMPRPSEPKQISEESDMDGEYEDEGDDREQEHNNDVEMLQLPSPVANVAPDDLEDELDLDLEAELEQALAKEMGSNVDESSESEEE